MTKVFIPRENEYDLKDVADEVKEAIEVIPVNDVWDILSGTGILKKDA